MKKILALLTVSMLFVTLMCAGAIAEESTSVYVYQDFKSGLNHFNMKAMMSAPGAEGLVIPMNEQWEKDPYSGTSCIRCQINTEPGTWGGWMFLTGVLNPGDEFLSFNDGSEPDQGENLVGMHELHFRARGQNGGEKVEFICFGFGDGNAEIAYPDTAKKISKKVELTTEWTEYVIDWGEIDLSNIICGFGYACSSGDSGTAENIFYVDEILYVP